MEENLPTFDDFKKIMEEVFEKDKIDYPDSLDGFKPIGNGLYQFSFGGGMGICGEKFMNRCNEVFKEYINNQLK